MTTTEINELEIASIENPPILNRKRKSVDLSGLISNSFNLSHNLKIPIELVFGLVFSGAVMGAIKGFSYSEHHPYICSIGGYFIGGVLGAISLTIGDSIFKDIKSMTSNYRINNL